MATRKNTNKKESKGEWEMFTMNNGHPTYSLTERHSITRETRQVNPKNGRVRNH